ncbi:carboxylic acid reductase [Nocardia sp. NPDC127526]|uniref:carboxylic acid reductase n=1 Tax=Nocardia sp. NPDC127526 TaxID=3345393 RepID=UPI0036452D36
MSFFTEAQEHRIADLIAHDDQIAQARPDPGISLLLDNPGLTLADLVRTVLAGYADRPALGSRISELVTDPETGRTEPRSTERFAIVTYRELARRAEAVARGLARGSAGGPPVTAGDRIAVLGFNSADYTVLDLASMLAGTVAVPLQSSASTAQLRPIIEETTPRVIAAGIGYLPAAVELALADAGTTRLVVFDYLPESDTQREVFAAAAQRLLDAGSPVVLESLAAVAERGRDGDDIAVGLAPDQLALLIYTSGSTGAPKGAMYPARLVANLWHNGFAFDGADSDRVPSVTMNFLPMSHVMGRGTLYRTLGSGGIAYFAASSDLSTFLEDLRLIRPTELPFVPRVWELLFQEYRRAVDRLPDDGRRGEREQEILAEFRDTVLGGRAISALTGSAPTSPEVREFVEALTQVPLVEVYGSTEAGGVLVDGRVRRPVVQDYKLVDVPELGYFGTDRPYPRGELVVKTDHLFPGYYRRPEVTAEVFTADGYYRTGDVVAEIAPDELRYVDRRNNVLKLSQGEFVAVSRLEADYEDSPLIEQIYLYGNSSRAHLLAVVVPAADAVAAGDPAAAKPLLAEALRAVAVRKGLQPYEIPRDFLIETTPFTVENGLLTGIRKLARPVLRQHYGERLEQLYQQSDHDREAELRTLRAGLAHRPLEETVSRTVAVVLGLDAAEVAPEARFTDLGGDSLSALTLANTLHELTGVEVPVGVIVGPATDLRALAGYLGAAGDRRRPTFAGVHASAATEIRASELTLDKFIDAGTLAAAPTLPRASGQIRTVLLTGATGFLGRFVALEWLERLSAVDGRLICLVRAADDEQARARLDAVFDSGDPELWQRYRQLAQRHLDVVAGDKGESGLGLDTATWQRLAETVDLIVDVAALVNHVLPYQQLFGPNVAGTAELIHLALTGRIKTFDYISTVAVGAGIDPAAFTETADVRAMSPVRPLDDSYANGYGNSKWAGEVLLREAHDLCGLPVTVFRCDMILVDGRYLGQLNAPDMFTRLLFSVLATGIAPESFHPLDASGRRQRSHYDGLPVDFIATAIAELGVREGFRTYHVMNTHDDGHGLDEFVDWLIAAGNPIERITGYRDWFGRFETALRALPEDQRKHSLLPLLHAYTEPQPPHAGSPESTARFRAAVRAARIGPDQDIPHITPETIRKYEANLRHLKLL